MKYGVNFAPPNQVEFDTAIYFLPGSPVPSIMELNDSVKSAFLGEYRAAYIQVLDELLPKDNVFRQTTTVDIHHSR